MSAPKKSLAARVAAGEADTPENVQVAIDDVKARRDDLLERAELARRANPVLEATATRLGLEGDDHLEWVRRNGGLSDDGHAAQMKYLYAYRYEEVDGEVLEIRVDGPQGEVRVIHRPDLYPHDKADPFAALASYEHRLAALRASEPASEG